VTSTDQLVLFAPGSVTVNAGGTLSVTGIADGIVGTSAGTITVASGQTVTITDGAASSFSGVISGGGSVTKAGAGTQTFAGANTYSGGTVITGGTLAISNPTALGTGNIAVGTGATLSSTVAFAVPTGATLSGAGTVTSTGNVTVNGGSTIRGGAPGTTGTLSVTTPVLVSLSDGTTAARTETTFSPTANSLIAVSGIVNFSSPSTSAPKYVYDVRSLGLTLNTPVTGTIMTATGGFQVNGVAAPNGMTFVQGTDFVLTSPDFPSFANVSLAVGGSGNALILSFTPVPEPTTVFGLAAGGMLLFRLRRRA
jgi:autotransporter-associated beta strand protein